MTPLNNSKFEAILRFILGRPDEAWQKQTREKLVQLTEAAPAEVTTKAKNPHRSPHFLLAWKESLMSLFSPKRPLLMTLRVGLIATLVIGIGLFSPGIAGLFERKPVSAQEILAQLATNIQNLQNSDGIVHRAERITNCYPAEVLATEQKQALFNNTTTSEVNAQGYVCSTTLTENWYLGQDNLTVTRSEDGEIIDIYMNYDGWSYSYLGGAKKASKQNLGALYESYPEAASTQKEPINLDELNSAKNDVQSVQSQLDDALLELQNRYGDVKIVGEETVNGRIAYRLQYDYQTSGEEKFGVAMNTIPVNVTLMNSMTTESEQLPVSIAVSTPLSTPQDPISAPTTQPMETEEAAMANVMAPEQNAIPAYPSDMTTEFWVDKETFEQLRYQETAQIDGQRQVIFNSEVLVMESLDRSLADEVFQFPLPEGIEIVDTTEWQREMNERMEKAWQIDIDQIVTDDQVSLYLPTALPARLELNWLAYEYPGQFTFMEEDYADFIPAEAKQNYEGMTLVESTSLAMSYSEVSQSNEICPPSEQSSIDYEKQLDALPVRMLSLRFSDTNMTGSPAEGIPASSYMAFFNFDDTMETRPFSIGELDGILYIGTTPESIAEYYLQLKTPDGRYVEFHAVGMEESEVLEIASDLTLVRSNEDPRLEAVRTVADRQTEMMNGTWQENALGSDLNAQLQASGVPVYAPSEIGKFDLLPSYSLCYDNDTMRLSLNNRAAKYNEDANTYNPREVEIHTSSADHSNFWKNYYDLQGVTPRTYDEANPSLTNTVEIRGVPATLYVLAKHKNSDVVQSNPPDFILFYQQDGLFIDITARGLSAEQFLEFAAELEPIGLEDAERIQQLEAAMLDGWPEIVSDVSVNP